MRALSVRRAIASATLLSLLASGQAQARPYSLDDLLRVEVLVGAEATPDGRWLIIQTYRGQGTAGRYGDDAWPQVETAALFRVDLRASGPATPLFERRPGTGYLPGPISPKGDHMVVYRLQARIWRAGIYDFASGSAKWLSAAPEIANYGRYVQWTDNDHVLMVVTASGEAPQRVGFSWQVRERRIADWTLTAKGEAPAYRLMGSGRFLQWGRPAPAHRLELWSLATPSPRVLATGDFLDMQASPDGRYAALLEEKEAIQAPPSATLTVATPSRRRDVRIVDLATGASVLPCPTCDLFTHLLSWSASSDELLVYAKAAPGGAGLLRLRAGDPRVTRVETSNVVAHRFASPENIPFVHAGWLGNEPLLFGQHADAPSERSDWYRMTAAGPQNLTADLEPAPDKLAAVAPGEALIEDKNAVWRLGPSGPATPVIAGAHLVPARRLGEGIRFAQNPEATSEPAILQSASGVTRLGSASVAALPSGDLIWTDGHSTLVRTHDDHGVSALILGRPGAAPTTLLVLNRFLTEVAPARERALHYAVGGRTLTGWLYTPAQPSSRPLPLVVVPYPGFVYDKPRKVLAPDGQDVGTGVPILVGAGFAVLIPSTPQDKTSSHWSDGITEAVVAATDAAIATGEIDKDRLALLGHSGGGYAVLVAASQTHRFKAVIAESAASNLLADWGAINPLFDAAPTFSGVINQQPGWSYAGQGHLWADPWTAPARYEANSPFFSVETIDAAVLLVSADHDFVQLSQSESMFSALYRLNRNAALLSFWGEGHVVSSPANLGVLYGTVIDWLRLNLDIPEPGLDAGASNHPASTNAAAALARRAQASTATH